MVTVRLDHDEELDLTFELLYVAGVLSLGSSVVVGCGIVDSELVLLKDVLALSSVAKIVVADEDTTSIVRNCIKEAGILDDVSKALEDDNEDAYKLHLVLDTEQLMLGVKTSIGAVR